MAVRPTPPLRNGAVAALRFAYTVTNEQAPIVATLAGYGGDAVSQDRPARDVCQQLSERPRVKDHQGGGLVAMGKRVCDNCGDNKDTDYGKTCPNGHFLCHSCASRHFHCTVCHEKLR